MQTIVKLSTAFGAAAISMAFACGVAMADTNNVVNTGNNVHFNGGSSQTTNVGVSNSNSAVINQSSSSNVNTGGNTANKNIGDTSIATGTASVGNAFSANANSNATAVTLPSGQSSNDTKVVNTGNHVNVNAGSNNTTNVGVTNENSAVVGQSSYSNVNTGNNDANKNIGDTHIVTGNAGVSNVFGTQVNSNQTLIGLGNGNWEGGNGDVLGITNTGNNLHVNGGSSNTTNIGVSNYNSAYIMQNAVACVNTGDNKANSNIGLNGADASIMTGAANVGNVFSATANANLTGINGAGLFLSPANDTNLTNTGNHVNVSGNGTTVNTDVYVTNANEALVSQSSENDTTTGNNKANSNIDTMGAGAVINSGMGGVLSGFMTNANFNWTGIGVTSGMPTSWWM